jgi:hypothetical protein
MALLLVLAMVGVSAQAMDRDPDNGGKWDLGADRGDRDVDKDGRWYEKT